MRKFFRGTTWSLSAGVAAAGVFGIPFPLESLVPARSDESLWSEVDWDAELLALLEP